MKKHLTALLLISTFCAFTVFITINEKTKTVQTVLSPTKISIDRSSKNSTSSDIICIENIEAFSLEPDNDFIDKHSKINSLSRTDLISLGYLAQDFAQKTLLNQRIKIKYGTKVTNECKYATISINGNDYNKILANSGFGIVDGKPLNKAKFEHNLDLARNLNLVVLNHHSNKYHTLDCPYGEVAHDKIIIPKSQLPTDSIPCKFCNSNKNNKTVKYNDFKVIPNIIQPSLYSSTGDIKTYITDFTEKLAPTNDCSTSACRELINLIDKSNSSIDIAIYGYRNIPEITKELSKAQKRGVKIRFITDSLFDNSKNYYKDNELISKLSTIHKTDKTNSQTLSNMLMHNKFLIFDNQTVYTGSMNLSPSGASGFDVNSIIIINSPEIAKLYTKEFEQMINGNFHTTKNKLSDNRKFVINDSEIEIYFSPKDQSSERIIELIKEAKTYIYVPTFLITHSEIANELIAAHNRGVDVRVIIDANSVTTRNTKHAQLRKAGILLKTENYAGKMHAKSMIIDNTYLITGSMNFSNSGVNKNDENIVIIKNKNITKAHKDFFLYLWTKIPNKYLKQNAKPESPDSLGSCTDGVDNNFNNKIDSQEEFCVN